MGNTPHTQPFAWENHLKIGEFQAMFDQAVKKCVFHPILRVVPLELVSSLQRLQHPGFPSPKIRCENLGSPQL